MAHKTLVSRFLPGVFAAALAAYGGGAAAVDFRIGEHTLRVDNLVTIGASWRTQDQDPSLIGKSTLYRMQNGPDAALCYLRTDDDGLHGPAPDNDTTGSGGSIQLVRGAAPAGCGTANADANQEFVDYGGSFSPNGDQGNLNFDKGDLVHALAKMTSDISFSIADYNFFARPIIYFDANYTSFEQNLRDTTFQDRHPPLPAAVEEQVGTDLDILDYNISKLFFIGERGVSVKIGNQVLNWGESSLLVFNSLNSINPLDATKVRFPGADLKEFFQPIGMAVIGTDLWENASLEGWYGYEWKPLIVDPVGTFFSQSDTLGAGGYYSMLSFGKVPDDPDGLFRGIDTCTGPSCFDSAGTLGSTSSRTIYRDFEEEARRRPDDGGQYGGKLSLFLEDFMNGTELAFYGANYHSRLPVVSAIAAQRTCIRTVATFVADCGYAGPGEAAAEEPLPVDTMRVIVEYPEDVRMLGTSFNMTIGDYALSGEYAYRDNLPTQIQTTDLAYAALQPAFDDTDNTIAPGTTIPGRRSAVPSFITAYRGYACTSDADCIQPGQYIRGYERLKTGQANLTVLRLIGGDNPIGASQMTILFEMGMNRVFNMPGLNELQFNGGGADTHISDGADGTEGINPPAVAGNSGDDTLRQNPTAHKDYKGFGTSESYGYRLLNLNRWDSAFMGANLETLFIMQHDVKGTSPGIGTNFLHGRKQIALGLRFDYLSTYVGEVRYSWNTGGGKRDGLRDRDNVFVTLGYQF